MIFSFFGCLKQFNCSCNPMAFKKMVDKYGFIPNIPRKFLKHYRTAI